MHPNKVALLIGACAVLHNIAILRNDLYNPRNDTAEDDQPDVEPYDGDQDGLLIRDYVCENFF